MKTVSATELIAEPLAAADAGGRPLKGGSLPEYVYARLREDIFDMRLLPGDQIIESEIAACFKVSRTPVREALQRLQSDGLMQGYVRGGWEVVPIDFKRFEELYQMRGMIEQFALRQLCAGGGDVALIEQQKAIWCVALEQRLSDGRQVAILDEQFHLALVRAAGNKEIASTFERLTDRIRIVRRLDFIYGDCVQSTYDEHAGILNKIAAPTADEAASLMARHIEEGHVDITNITLHRLQSTRASAGAERLAYVQVKVMRHV
ncbi:GntR family transcriptional regulator [Herbaspirillum sp. RTI4]|uniref:GntR family transcriptional regulator n=1 Tax=Herbaspirillum sp. RTI4 TaxID=3048640 RepID=UPI002AB5C3C2|nr:GntR family transcriptional regulator [Herbaspirillum sp. RTI4]MDY7579765.1 GntR family transcriptional regulator [Herbaspirillum sp. RTI4]MEA9982739.1 GntR family transcriptional regulator [Herbaspirillum sp. RTI4]